ncbi:IS3 family transposase [Streptomyces sp. NPDC056254]|uniref:IS3 family transposase n=1 Tax=Streptomyces sp. NPDC056254 TaxID=3345763 RepID=UPI0035DC7CF9
MTEVHPRSRGLHGALRVHAALLRDGFCGRRRVARLMRAAGLAGRRRQADKRITVPDRNAQTRPDLARRDFRPDPSALPTGEGWPHRDRQSPPAV